ncbi:MAG: 30S ribosomal protein S2, partial [Prevotella sp.]|nr:30S ribosomal protein S2 [Prevotella sp.]
IADLTRLPSALFVVDVLKEQIAVREANRLGIPVFGIVDTNSDPNNIDFVIPANDDAKDSVEIILNACCAAMAEGIEERKVEKADEKAADAQAEVDEEEVKPRRQARKARKEETPVAEAPAEEAAPAEEEAPAAE